MHTLHNIYYNYLYEIGSECPLHLTPTLCLPLAATQNLAFLFFSVTCVPTCPCSKNARNAGTRTQERAIESFADFKCECGFGTQYLLSDQHPIQCRFFLFF